MNLSLRTTNQFLCRRYSTQKKDLILSVLRSTATKREAKQYISKYTPQDVWNNEPGTLRLAILKLRDVKSYKDGLLDKIGDTVSRLSKLGVSPVVVIDAGKERNDFLNLDNQPFRHYHRAITWKAGLVSDAVEQAGLKARPMDAALELGADLASSDLGVNKDMIVQPLVRGIVPIVSPVAYDDKTGQDKLVAADDVVFSLIKSLHDYSIEKVIFIDPLGGIPSVERNGGSHVYVNLQQELQDIQAELHIGFLTSSKEREIHLDNLAAMNKVLGELPMSATGMITTPEVAALSSSRNPIIYNVLTDRSVVSPSLPVSGRKTPAISTTMLRRGIPVTVLKSDGGLDLVKEAQLGKVDLDRLESLVSDSFNKKLNMKHYLERVNGKIAGVVVAGDYQGAAVVTWEDGSSSTSHPSHCGRTLYLDKFAVQQKSQGASGVADIVFNAMMKHLFPQTDILWRARAANPVNKWYFERCRGTFRINQEWIGFWAGSAKPPNAKTLEMYKKICTGIKSSFL